MCNGQCTPKADGWIASFMTLSSHRADLRHSYCGNAKYRGDDCVDCNRGGHRQGGSMMERRKIEQGWLLCAFGLDAIDLRRLIEDTAVLAQNWPTQPLATGNKFLRKVVNRIVVEPLQIKVE
jgi:hypothetical protein